MPLLQPAIAFHDHASAGETLIRRGREHSDPDVRSDAWFWLARSGNDDSEDVIRRAVFEDRDDDVREDAVFALSQLPADRAVDALTGLLESRDVGMEIREQALFWLVQSDSDEAFEYIDNILSDN